MRVHTYMYIYLSFRLILRILKELISILLNRAKEKCNFRKSADEMRIGNECVMRALYERQTIFETNNKTKIDERDLDPWIKNRIDECVSAAYGSSSLTMRNTSVVACVCVCGRAKSA